MTFIFSLWSFFRFHYCYFKRRHICFTDMRVAITMIEDPNLKPEHREVFDYIYGPHFTQRISDLKRRRSMLIWRLSGTPNQ